MSNGEMTVFVVTGAPRSGTTLMQRIINTHSAAACTHEYGLNRIFNSIDIIFEIDERTPYVAASGVVDNFDGAKSIDEYSSMRDQQATNLGGDAFLVPRRSRDHQNFFRSFFENISGKKSLAAVGDKTPNLYVSDDIRRILGSERNIKFIYMIRNPLDVVRSSMRRTFMTANGHDGWHIETINEAIIEWIDNWEYTAKLFRKGQSDALVIKYEDLENNYELQTNKLAEFLRIPNEFAPLSMSFPEKFRDFDLSFRDKEEINFRLGGLIEDWRKWDATTLLSMFPRVISTVVDVGDTILAGDKARARFVLRQGFGAVEDWGTWTHGHQASIRFKIRNLSGRHKVVIELAHLNFFGHEKLQFFVKSEFDSVIEFSLTASDFNHMARSSFLCTVVDGIVSFEILIPYPKRPEDPPQADHRPIGIAVHSVRPIMIVE